MEEIIKILISNKLYIILLAVIASIIIYTILKKIIALLAISIIACLLYIGINQLNGNESGKINQAYEELNIVQKMTELKKDIMDNIKKIREE